VVSSGEEREVITVSIEIVGPIISHV
jgi:hypothetical protein